MRLFLLMLYFLFLESCSTVEVGKEIIKAGNSVKTTVSEIITNKKDDSKIIEEKNIEAETEFQIEAEIPNTRVSRASGHTKGNAII